MSQWLYINFLADGIKTTHERNKQYTTPVLHNCDFFQQKKNVKRKKKLK